MASAHSPGISGPAWLRLLHHLSVSPMTPTQLATLENKHLSEVSRTLRTLRDGGLVECMETGSRERYYHATQQGYVLLHRWLR